MSNLVIEIPQRNEYGALEVKAYINRFSTYGLVGSMLLLILLWGGYYLQKVIEENRKAQLTNVGKIDLTDLNQQQQEEAPPPPPEVEVQQQDLGTTVQAGTPNPVEDDQVQDVDFASFDDMSKALSTKGDIDISNMDLNNINLDAPRGDLNVGANEKEGNDDDFIQVEKEVSFDYAELQKSVEYPELAKKAGIQGTVVIKVYINNQGKAAKTQVLASDNKMLNESATKAIMSFTGYKPAIQNKQPVSMWITIPIKFRLN